MVKQYAFVRTKKDTWKILKRISLSENMSIIDILDFILSRLYNTKISISTLIDTEFLLNRRITFLPSIILNHYEQKELIDRLSTLNLRTITINDIDKVIILILEKKEAVAPVYGKI